MPRRRKYKRVYKTTRRDPFREKLTDDQVIDKYFAEHTERIISSMPPEYVNKNFGGNYREAFRDVVKEEMKFKKPGTGYTKIVDGEQEKVSDRHFTVREAISRSMRSKIMNPDWKAYNRGEANLIEGLKSNKKARDEIIGLMSDEKKIRYKRRQRKDRRRKETITYLKGGFDTNKMKFIGTYDFNGTNTAVYIYDNEVAIMISKSPRKGAGADFDIRSVKEFEQLKEINKLIPIRELERE